MLPNLIAATVFAILGIVIFLGAFLIFERLYPGLLRSEVIEDNNTALAVLIGAVAIALAIIISAAIA